MSPREPIPFGKPRETVEIDGETYIKVPTTVENLRGGWVRFHDVIDGGVVDVRAERPTSGTRWKLTGLRVLSHRGKALTSDDLKRLTLGLAERAAEARTMDVEAIVKRSRTPKDKTARIAAVRKLLADLDDAGRPQADAVQILMDDTGISRGGAYLWIKEAKGQGK